MIENSTIVSMLFSYANIYPKAVTLYRIVLIFNIILTFKIYYECILFFVIFTENISNYGVHTFKIKYVYVF